MLFWVVMPLGFVRRNYHFRKKKRESGHLRGPEGKMA
jgi:hypothetical protein